MHPFIILVALIAVVLTSMWYSSIPAAQRTKARNRLLLYGGLGVLAVLLITGRLHPLFAALAALIPVVQRLLSLAKTSCRLLGTTANIEFPTAPGKEIEFPSTIPT